MNKAEDEGGGGSGWLSESQMDYQLIRIKKKEAPGVVVVEEEEGGGRRRGVRDRKYGGGGEKGAEAEER